MAVKAQGSVKAAVLGLVVERPGYGYELIRRFEGRIGGWRQAPTGVYHALDALAASGDVRVREDRADGSRRVAHRRAVWWEVTEQGRGTFEEWLLTPAQLAPLRDEMHLKIALASVGQLPRLIELTREQEQIALDRLDALRTATAVAGDRLDEDLDWGTLGHLWVQRTEAAHIAVGIEALQEARKLMKAALRGRGDRRT